MATTSPDWNDSTVGFFQCHGPVLIHFPWLPPGSVETIPPFFLSLLGWALPSGTLHTEQSHLVSLLVSPLDVPAKGSCLWIWIKLNPMEQ